MQDIDLATQTMFAELLQRSLDAEFDVAVDRWNQAKSVKDIQQAQILIHALSTKRPLELGHSWLTAWNTGKSWRKKLTSGKARLLPDAQALLDTCIERASR